MTKKAVEVVNPPKKRVYETVTLDCPMCKYPLSFSRGRHEVYSHVKCRECRVSITVKKAEEADERPEKAKESVKGDRRGVGEDA